MKRHRESRAKWSRQFIEMNHAHGFALRARQRIGIFLFAILSLAVSVDLAAQDKSSLWRVSTGADSIYVLGSIHYLRAENYPLKKAVMDAFDQSKRLVLEIDLNAVSPEAAQRLTMEKAIYHDGTTLPQHVSPETYQSVSQRASQMGIDLRLLSPMKPWFAAVTLVAMRLQEIGLDPKLGVDQYLAAEAKRRSKLTSGLETLEFQLGLLDQLSKADQELMLRETVAELELLDQNINEIVRSWANGDEAKLAKLLLAGMMEYPEIHQKIVVERNRRWLPEIEDLLQQKSGAMVVVGAAHLVGPDGIIEMLKAKGYSVEQK